MSNRHSPAELEVSVRTRNRLLKKLLAEAMLDNAESFNGRLRDELLNETLFVLLAHAPSALVERSVSSRCIAERLSLA